MMFITLFTLWLIATSGIKAIPVGVIYHGSLITSIPNMTIHGLNCGECLCTMFTSSASSLNCFANNSVGVICQVFLDGFDLSLNSSQLKTNLNSTFYFRPSNQSKITTAQIMTSTVVTTSKDTSTATTTVGTTTVTSCTTQGPANLLTVSGSIPWTLYSYNYTAINPAPTLSFTVHNGPAQETAYLDDVSVVDNSAPSIQLLNNPSFENSTSTVTGWIIWCTSSCTSSGDGGQITTSGCHSGSGSNCYMDNCNGGYDFIGQSFPARVGHNYTISFWLYKSGGAAGTFYANIS